MWNIDIETRIRDLNAEAENHHARLLDTMTETDGSAKRGRIPLTGIVERLMRAFAHKVNGVRTLTTRRASIASGK